MFKRIYLEITNVCNLRCSFCPGTKREAGFMSAEQFRCLAAKLRSHTDYLCFHLMGEPLLHPDFPRLLSIARELGFRVIITTNATLLPLQARAMLDCPAVYQVNFSLQAFEGSGLSGLDSYLEPICDFAKKAAEKGIYCSLRLWNGGGENFLNGGITRFLHKHFPGNWQQGNKSLRLADGVFLESAQQFDWPDTSAPEAPVRFCRALRDHVGVLCDGTVVPCCLDSEGCMALGNLHEQSMEDILSSPRARAIYEGFSRGCATEELCRHCGYAERF